MKKVILALLEAKFPQIDTKALLQIIEATPNPTVATEILCNLYEEPDFETHYQVYSDKIKTQIYTFISFDPLKSDGVTYQYDKEKTKGAYFPKALVKSDINLENFDALQLKDNGEGQWIEIKTGETEIRTNTMSLERWMYLEIHSAKQKP